MDHTPQSNTTTTNQPQPKDGLAGLVENLKFDLSSGFIIFLLALPLSLGIAKASEVPPIMGLVTAIIGGILVSFLAGSKLTIKGPAAGLIVIIAGAVTEMGGGTEGWKMAAGAMFIAGLLQILFGVLKLGRMVNFFPLSAIHGMLAAIGLIIISKQVPILLNIDPATYKGLGPIELLMKIPHFFANLNPPVALLGFVCLMIAIYWAKMPFKFLKMVPGSLVILLIAIPAAMFMSLGDKAPYNLVKVGNILDSLHVNMNFDGMSQTGVFIKYVVMMAIVGSLESLLTVKAIDLLDPFKRKSDTNKDLIAIGVGNSFAAVFGGIPMISEVARSSANVNNGAKTRWANLFHGCFLLIFALLAYPLLEMIPNTALAAMLIAVGIRLAHPKEFVHNYKIGPEQLVIFLVTVFFTLFEDLLIGIFAGIAVKIIIHLIRGASLKSIFNIPTEVVKIDEDNYQFNINNAAIFTNILGIDKKLATIPIGKNVDIHFEDSVRVLDHTVLECLEQFANDYSKSGGTVRMTNMDKLIPVSKHPHAARRNVAIKA